MLFKCVVCNKKVVANCYNQLYDNSWVDVATDAKTGELDWVCSKECENKWYEED